MVPLEDREQLEGIGSFSIKWAGTQVVQLGSKCLYLLSCHAGLENFMGLGSFIDSPV